MIRRGGVDPFTKRPRVIVQCDATGCEAAEFGPEDHGPQDTSEIYAKNFGWEIGPTPHTRVGEERTDYPAFCPKHAMRPAPPCPHDSIVTPDYRNPGDPVCERCGAHLPPPAWQAQAMGRARSLRALMDRQGTTGTGYAKGGVINRAQES